MHAKNCYLMRGLPSCGKSHTAKQLAGREGVICETDRFFYTQAGDQPVRYAYDIARLDEARRWNFERFSRAVGEGLSPIVVDRGNSLNLESHVYARLAADHGYCVELKEPDSPWWQEIRVLSKYKPLTLPILRGWARKLADLSLATHRVPASTIEHWMEHWKWDVSIKDILDYQIRDPKEDSLFFAFMQQDAATQNAESEIALP